MNLDLNENAVLVECWYCGYHTDVYGFADLDMWEDEGVPFPECPRCGWYLQRAKKQYIVL